VTEPSQRDQGGAGNGATAPTASTVEYRERLWPPVWLWLVASVVAATLGLAFGVPLGPVAGIAAWLVPQALIIWVLVTAAAMVTVDEQGLVAGRARLPFSSMGAVTALDSGAAGALRGRDADPRAYLLLRPWVPRAVRVDVDDRRDPAPYWYVSTRRAAELAAALGRARARHPGRHDGGRPDEAG
jgi:Protein of unknown function (DUF3093)